MNSPIAHTQLETVQHAGTTLTVVASEHEAEVVVVAKQIVADGVVSLVLREAHGRLLPHWEPGAHVDLVLDGAPTRQYSLCGDLEDRSTYRLGVLRDPLTAAVGPCTSTTTCPCASAVRATTSRWRRRSATCSSPVGSGSRRSSPW